MQKIHMNCVDADKLCYCICIMTRGGIYCELKSDAIVMSFAIRNAVNICT